MSRMIVVGGVALGFLVGAGLSFGQNKDAGAGTRAADDLLASKDLHRSAEIYVLRAEDEAKKASDAAEARLKEYRHAVAQERGEIQDLIDLTKERDEMKKEMDQAVPAIRQQIQALQQQQAALRMQSGAMGGGYSGRYGGRYGRMAGNPATAQVNALSVQINMLQAQSSQITQAFNQLDGQVKQLNSQAEAKAREKAAKEKESGSESKKSSTDERKEAYEKAVAAVRKLVDETKKKYADLAADTQVQSALAALNQQATKFKYVLGPSKKFNDVVKALEQAEAKIASNTIIDEPKPVASAKRKTKTAKKH